MMSLPRILQDLKDKIAGLANKADKTYVDQKVADLVNGAPEQLDTLRELSNAMNDDKDFAATINTAISKKLDKEGALKVKSWDASTGTLTLTLD